ncbi:MAG TPA: cytochrome c peroxidase, partial [Gemmataceae bacterium]|nr:cytochrome c peroxidase [Gemmataceae bacterium]
AAGTRERVVRIKVPAGLWDPNRWNYLPAANPPTLNKWALGKRLFFDDSWLLPAPQKLSCARCHDPAKGFSDGLPARSDHMHPPTLINAMYSEHQFWDGRAGRLEEVVLRSLEDERPQEDEGAAAEAERRHVWPGVVHRLTASPEYHRRFRQVFGTPPTADALGKALATYLRTILTGNSIYDRAVRAAQGKPLTAAHFEKVLDKPALEALDMTLQRADIGADRLDVNKPADVARDVFAGWQLFQGKGRCVACHPAPHNFHDDGFHNLGVREALWPYGPGKEPGRFAALPLGLKDPAMIGAYKTPTLRALPRTAPYFHDGSRRTLVEVVGYHLRGGQRNPSLDPLLRDPSGQPRRLGLSDAENRLLVLFLMALDGDPIDPVVADPERGLGESK